MAVDVEKAKFSDFRDIFDIERECFTSEAFSKEEIESLLLDPDSITFLARTNGRIVGFIIGSIREDADEKIGHVLTLDVALQSRRRGVGRALLENLEKYFSDSDVEACFLEVRADNTAARRLYQKQGYVEVAILKEYYSTGSHGIRLKKVLK